jgi:hypothetical protein
VWRLAAARRLVARDELGDVVSPDLQLPLLGVGQAAPPMLENLVRWPPTVGDVRRRLLVDDTERRRAPELDDDGVRPTVAAVQVPLEQARRVVDLEVGAHDGLAKSSFQRRCHSTSRKSPV